MQITVRFISLGLASVINLMLGSFLLWRYRSVRLTRIFSYEILAVAGFSFFTAGLSTITSQGAAVAWVRAFEVFAHATTLTFFYFAVVFSRSESKANKWIFIAAAAIFTVEGGARALGLAPVLLEFRGDQGWFPVNDRFYNLLYVPTMLTLLFGGLFLVVRARIRAKSPLLKNQLSYFFVAMVTAILLSNANLIKGIEFLALFAPVAYTGIISYSITRHRLFETSLLLRKGAVAAGLASLVAVAYVMALLMGSAIWGEGSGSTPSTFAAFFTALVMALAYGPLQATLQSALNHWMKIKDSNPSQRLLEYSMLISMNARLADYLDASAIKLCSDLGLESASFLLKDRLGHFEALASYPPQLPPEDGLSGEEPFLMLLQGMPRGADLDELAWTREFQLEAGDKGGKGAEWLAEFLKSRGIQLAFPILENEALAGLMLLGPKTSGKYFLGEEIDFLAALSRQMATAIQNGKLHGQVQQADRLSTLGTLSASMAHELRNPLTSISTFVQMLPSRYADEKFREKFSRIVSTEIEKLTRLTDQLLSFSRPSTEARINQDLLPLCGRVRQLLKHQFSKKNVEFEVLGLEGECWATVNESEISQVLINLLLNALQATSGGGKVMLALSCNEELVQVRVTDNGCGMTAEQQRQIFNPFFSTKEDGTGLGLPTCQRIVEQHGGQIQVQSNAGVGSSFTIMISSTKAAGLPAALVA